MDFKLHYIDNSKSFKEAIRLLSDKPEIFIDLEFDKNHFKYGFNLCLMQIFDGEQNCFLIDPFSEIDIKNIFSILEDKSVQIVCFAFNEDMRLLHSLGAKPTNILDLSLVMRLLNYQPLSINNSLATVLEDDSFSKNKPDQQKSNWVHRPLSDLQKRYAMEDVLYLPQLKTSLLAEVKQLNRMEWVQEEMFAYEQKEWENGNSFNFLDFKDKRELSLREWIRYSQLMKKREEFAKELDLPSYKVIRKEQLIVLARFPEKVDNWITSKGIHPKLRTEKKKLIIEKALALAEEKIKAENIGINTPSIPLLTIEEKRKIREQQKRIRFFKSSFYSPIKEEISKKYGENFSSYILSTRKIEGFINRKIQMLSYEKDLILEMSRKINVKLPEGFE